MKTVCSNKSAEKSLLSSNKSVVVAKLALTLSEESEEVIVSVRVYLVPVTIQTTFPQVKHNLCISSSSGSSVPLQLGLPVAVPPQYSGLKEVSIEAVRARLRLLYHFSDLMYSSWRLLNLSPNNQVGKEPHTRNFSVLRIMIKHS